MLARVDRGQERLDRRIVFSDKDLVTYSPVTKDHVGPAGMSVADICAAAVTLSDNTAGNLMLASFGGPAALTAYARSLGDGLTRLDRIETALNEAAPGDPRDTTTPNAMLGDMQRLLVGDALSAKSRRHLTQWLLASKTGTKRIRAGLPSDWRVGDKTGGGDNGTANDIAVAWPPGVRRSWSRSTSPARRWPTTRAARSSPTRVGSRSPASESVPVSQCRFLGSPGWRGRNAVNRPSSSRNGVTR